MADINQESGVFGGISFENEYESKVVLLKMLEQLETKRYLQKQDSGKNLRLFGYKILIGTKKLESN